jgi:methionyl-tRNA synthetase
MNMLPWMSIGFIPLMFWSLTWKGLALWHAAKRDDKWWFIGLLVVNTVGILELCYLLFVVRLFSKVGPDLRSKKTTKKKRK